MAPEFLTSQVLPGEPINKHHHRRMITVLIVILLIGALVCGWYVWQQSIISTVPTPQASRTPSAHELEVQQSLSIIRSSQVTPTSAEITNSLKTISKSKVTVSEAEKEQALDQIRGN